MAEKKEPAHKIVADNRKARFNYEIGEVFEAGIALTGTEVKSLRTGRATIAESYADARGGEIWLDQFEYPRIPAGEPLQSCAETAAQAAAPQAPDQEARRLRSSARA